MSVRQDPILGPCLKEGLEAAASPLDLAVQLIPLGGLSPQNPLQVALQHPDSSAPLPFGADQILDAKDRARQHCPPDGEACVVTVPEKAGHQTTAETDGKNDRLLPLAVQLFNQVRQLSEKERSRKAGAGEINIVDGTVAPEDLPLELHRLGGIGNEPPDDYSGNLSLSLLFEQVVTDRVDAWQFVPQGQFPAPEPWGECLNGHLPDKTGGGGGHPHEGGVGAHSSSGQGNDSICDHGRSSRRFLPLCQSPVTTQWQMGKKLVAPQ